jgi:hypothetical protein
MVPPRVSEILRALKGLPPSEASALLRTVLVGLDELERQSIRKLLPEQSPELGAQAITLLADPRDLPTLMQAGPMPWEPIADAELVPMAPAPAAAPTSAPAPAPAPAASPAPSQAPAEAASNPEVELQRMMKRSRMILAGAIAAVVLIIAGAATIIALTRGGDEVAAAPERPAPPPKKRTRPHPPPMVEEDDPLPSLPTSPRKAQPQAQPAQQQAAKAPAAKPAAAQKDKGGFNEWPGDGKRRTVAAATKAADEAFEDEDLKKMWNER